MIAIKVDVRGDKKVFSIGLERDTVITKIEICRVENEAPTRARVVVIAEAANGLFKTYRGTRLQLFDPKVEPSG